jgi:WD40 repeat protein
MVGEVRTPEELRSPDGATPEEDVEERGAGMRTAAERPTRLEYALHMTLKGHKRGVAAVKWSPDGRWIASCCKYFLLPRFRQLGS